MTPRPATSSRALLALAASVLALAAALPAAAAEPGYGSTVGASSGQEGSSRHLDLSIGRSVIIDLPRDAKEVFVGNPGVANAVVRSTRKIFLIGVGNGATSVFVMDGDGRQITTLEVNVGRDLSVLRQTLKSTIPTGRIEVKPAGDSILLTGVVQSAGEAQQAVDIAKAFVGQSTPAVPATGGSNGVALSLGGAAPVSGNVINGLTIAGRDQVMLRVSLIEVDRSVVKQLGVSTSGSWSTFQFATTAAFPISTQALAALNTVGGSFLGTGTNGVGATLAAFERARVSRTLAEPTLVTVSGESATFTAGGEIPVPSDASCAVASATTATSNAIPICSPSVGFKPYGVNLAFTPVVLSEGRISMRVNTEVTELDPENGIKIGTITVPSFRVRKSQTTVELPSGATMMTAGLISNNVGQAISGLPGLLNLPVLGALFRSRDYQRRETELMIMVSPFIAKPMEAAQVKRPDDGLMEPDDPQTLLLGKLNKLYGVAGPSPAGTAAYKGRIGFITD